MKRSEGKVLLFLPYILILVMVVLQVESIYPYNVVPVFSVPSFLRFDLPGSSFYRYRFWWALMFSSLPTAMGFLAPLLRR